MKVKRAKSIVPFTLLKRRSDELARESSGMEPQSEREQREMALAMAAANQQNRFTNPMTQAFMDESHPLAKEYIEADLFGGVGYDGDSVANPWSAATVSDLAKAFDPTFKGSALHADYINRAFSGDGNYRADKINKRTDFKPGDILFQGRGSTEGDKFRNFKNRAKEGEQYSSHSDMIIGTGVDADGRKYYDVQGGNKGDQLYQRRLYAKDIDRMYAGRLTQ
jgi:hypothetical protein